MAKYIMTIEDEEDYKLNDSALEIIHGDICKMDYRELSRCSLDELAEIKSKIEYLMDDVNNSTVSSDIKARCKRVAECQIEDINCVISDIKYEEECRESSRQLNEFYEKHLKGATKEQNNIGCDVYLETRIVFDYTKAGNKEYIDTYFAEVINTYIANGGKYSDMGFDYLRKCVDVAESYSTYSDWYKDINGIRPRWIFD